MWWVMVWVAALVGAATAIPCVEAYMRCVSSDGCGLVLQNYLECSSKLQADPTYCPEVCHYSLAALVSTEEGKRFTECECSDEYCEEQKRRTDVCRPQVLKSLDQEVVPCREAELICMADSSCFTALDFYNSRCKAMFHGKKCTPRCQNSIGILRRQQYASKLTKCRCDGKEQYDCAAIKSNMDALCFHKARHHHHPHNKSHNEVEKPPVGESEPGAAGRHFVGVAVMAALAITVALVT